MPALDFRHLATSAAILIDKLRLESGDASTGRRHEAPTSEEDFDRRVNELVEAVREEAASG